MRRHLLLTVSDDPSALHGIRFVGDFFQNKTDLALTLFYTAARPTLTAGALSESQGQRVAERIFEPALELLRHLGFSADTIESKFMFRAQGTARDIIKEAARGLYDAVVLGRRGAGWFDDLLGDSVGKSLMEIKHGSPFWICRQPEAGRRGVLVCVDGSQESQNILDHVAFMLAEQDAHNLTLLTARKPNRENGLCTKDIFAGCLEILDRNEMPRSRVTTREITTDNIPRAILDTATREGFAAVALGRTGAGGGFLRNLFLGSVSSLLFRELTGAALMVSH